MEVKQGKENEDVQGKREGGRWDGRKDRLKKGQTEERTRGRKNKMEDVTEGRKDKENGGHWEGRVQG